MSRISVSLRMEMASQDFLPPGARYPTAAWLASEAEGYGGAVASGPVTG